MKKINKRFGFSSLMVFLMGMVIVMLVQSAMTFNAASYNLVTGIDVLRQQRTERNSVAQVLKETLLQRYEASGASYNPTGETIGELFVKNVLPMTQGSNGVTYGFSPGQLPGTTQTQADFAEQFTANGSWLVGQQGSSVRNMMFPSMYRPGLITNHMDQNTAALRALRGVGQGTLQLLMSGPFSELTAPTTGSWPWLNPDNLNVDQDSGPWYPFPAFKRYVEVFTSTGSKADSAHTVTFEGRYRAFTVPITNYNLIPYGLPATVGASGGVPVRAPLMVVNTGVKPLVASTNNPMGDPTAFSDLYAPPGPGEPEVLPYRYRETVSAAWDMFEFMFKPSNYPISEQSYLDSLYFVTTKRVDLGDLASKTPEDLATHSFPEGFTYDLGSRTLTINLAAIPAPYAQGTAPNWWGISPQQAIHYVVDPNSVSGAVNQIVIQGDSVSPTTSVPIMVVVENRSIISGGMATPVLVSSTNTRPVMLIMVGCVVSFSQGVNFSGAIFTDRQCLWTGNPSIYGTLAYFHSMNVGTTQVYGDPNLRRVFADMAPRMFVAAVRVRRK